MADLELAGVDDWAESAVVILCRFKVLPLAQWEVKREFLQRLKKSFDQHGIEIPFPHLTVYAGQGKDALAPPLRILAEDRRAGEHAGPNAEAGHDIGPPG